MKRAISGVRSISLVALTSFLGVASPVLGWSGTTSSVNLSPGESIQWAVDAAPAGTTFHLHPGVYRMQSVAPKTNDIFIGQRGVILNGSQILSFQRDSANNGLWVANATASTYVYGTCASSNPMCGYAQDLFIEGELQSLVSSSERLIPGSWYFDRNNNKVYLPANPGSHVVELGMSLYAFYGKASGVQIDNLTVEKYANPAQQGAVGGNRWTPGLGAGWIVNNVECRWNHGTGISLGSESQILNSYIHNNGQLGIAFYRGSNSRAIKNEISWNNYAGVSYQLGGRRKQVLVHYESHCPVQLCSRQ